MSAVSGIEIALQGILGKSLGLPVWRLPGIHVRNEMAVCRHLGFDDKPAV